MAPKTATGVLAVALVALPLAAASAATSQKRPSYKQADANGDGTVTVQEAVKAGVPKSEAKREDIDNDGKLTKADWKFVDMNPKNGDNSG